MLRFGRYLEARGYELSKDPVQLKKKRDPQRFEQTSKDIEVHLAQEAAGLVRVLFGGM